MALNAFLKIDGIDGSSVVSGHENELQLLGFGISVHNSGSRHTATGGGQGKGEHGDLSFQMEADKALPLLHNASMAGDHIEEATLFVLRAAGDSGDPAGLKYLEFKMKKVLISSISWSGGGSDAIMLSGSVNFGEYEVIYTPQAHEGGGEGDITQGYHISEAHKV